MSDTTLQTFEADVIEMSRQVPVLVDFWAPWCGPCRTLGPMLEKLEHEAAGKWKLVKINVDEHQPLAAHFGVRSIPHVIAFVDGKPVEQFVGVLPESGLREFLARVTPAPSALALRQAALALDPGADAARIEYAGFLLDGNAITEAEAEFGMLSARAPQQDGYDALRTRLQTVREASALPDASVLSARVAADPGDLAARLDLARQHIAHHDYEAALEQLLAIVRADRAYEDGVARKTMLAVFDLMADRPDAVSRWRRQLSTALN